MQGPGIWRSRVCSSGVESWGFGVKDGEEVAGQGFGVEIEKECEARTDITFSSHCGQS